MRSCISRLTARTWSVKPSFWMQPWTLMSPDMMGQFPAAARIFRQGLVAEGDLLLDLNLKLSDLFELTGTPLPQDAAFDELRLKDVPKEGQAIQPGQRIDPLVHLTGRTNVSFTESGGPSKRANLSKYIDHKNQTVTSTTGELMLDFGKGLLKINAPAAQGASGMLSEFGTVDLADMTISSKMSLGHVVVVSLDGRPLASSSKMLLQVMSEEKPSGFITAPAADEFTKIVSIGTDPWRVKRFEGTVSFKRSDAGLLRVTPLDVNGEPIAGAKTKANGAVIVLDQTTLYYLIEGA